MLPRSVSHTVGEVGWETEKFLLPSFIVLQGPWFFVTVIPLIEYLPGFGRFTSDPSLLYSISVENGNCGPRGITDEESQALICGSFGVFTRSYQRGTAKLGFEARSVSLCLASDVLRLFCLQPSVVTFAHTRESRELGSRESGSPSPSAETSWPQTVWGVKFRSCATLPRWQ